MLDINDPSVLTESEQNVGLLVRPVARKHGIHASHRTLFCEGAMDICHTVHIQEGCICVTYKLRKEIALHTWY